MGKCAVTKSPRSRHSIRELHLTCESYVTKQPKSSLLIWSMRKWQVCPASSMRGPSIEPDTSRTHVRAMRASLEGAAAACGKRGGVMAKREKT